MTTKQCEICNKDFEARAKSSKFCSDKCGTISKVNKKREKLRQERIDELGERLVVIEELMKEHSILYFQASKMYDAYLEGQPLGTFVPQGVKGLAITRRSILNLP